MFARFNALPLLGCLAIVAVRLTLQYPSCMDIASGLNNAGLGTRCTHTARVGSGRIGSGGES